MWKTVRRGFFAAGVVAAWACAAMPAVAQSRRGGSTLPELPGSGGGDSLAPAQATDPTNDSAAPTPPLGAPPSLSPRQLYEHVRRGVVIIERSGAPAAIGTVLSGDGRILTALSGLSGSESADVRYADGTGVHAKVVYSDKALDLALLAPESPGPAAGGRRTEGLAASELDPAGAEIRAMLPGRGAHLGPAVAALKGRADAHGVGEHGRSGVALFPMLDVAVQGAPVAGAPLLDPTGDVVAVLVRACKGPAAGEVAPPPGSWPQGASPALLSSAHESPCQPMVVGVPVSAVRSFLARASAAVAPAAAAPWLGIRGESERAGGVHGVRVVDVAAASPAEQAGLKAAGDVIVAVDGRPIDSPEMLGESIGKHAVGDSVKLLVFGGGKFRELTVVLRSAP